MKKLIDADGNELPTPPDGSDVAHMIYLLEYCRRRKFKLGPLAQVGDVVIQVTDPHLENEEAKAFAETDIWREHGHQEE